MKKSEFMDLELGDIVVGAPLMQGLNPEGMDWEVVEITDKDGQRAILFEVSWLQVPVGKIELTWKSGKVVAGELV